MQWLSENYNWLFDGIGALLVMAVLGYLVRRILRNRQKGSAALTAQGAKVMNSPVASGSNNTQTVHAPTIHAQTVNYGHVPVAPQPAPPPPKAKTHKVLPNVQYIGAQTISIRQDWHNQGLVEDGSQENAIVIRFANEPRPDAQNLSARVKAVLIYRYGQKEVDVAGAWLDEASDVIDLEPDGRRHKLIAGMLIDGEFAAITAKTFVAHRRYWYESDNLPLKGFQGGLVSVNLTDLYGSLLFQGEFAVSLKPLRIAPKSTDRSASSCDFWLAFDARGSRPLMIQHSGDEVGFDVVVKIPADGSGFTSDVINRLEPNGSWVSCLSNGNFVHLESIRHVLAETVLRGTEGDNPKTIPVLVNYRTLTQQNCECRLEIRLPLKDGIQFALPEK
jgi:hypothetical protein